MKPNKWIRRRVYLGRVLIKIGISRRFLIKIGLIRRKIGPLTMKKFEAILKIQWIPLVTDMLNLQKSTYDIFKDTIGDEDEPKKIL